MNGTQTLRQKLLNYVIQYHNKPHINMYWITNSIIKRLKSDENVTPRQFQSLIRWLERENEFKHMTQTSIKEYFQPIIYNSTKDTKYEESTSVSLEQFFT